MTKLITIKNLTKQTILTHRGKILTREYQKAIGLMFSIKKSDFGLIFSFNREQYIPLHMFFVFYSIDVLYLSQDKKVIEMKKHFKPFTLYNPKHKASYVIEIPNNRINKTHTEINDIISFENL